MGFTLSEMKTGRRGTDMFLEVGCEYPVERNAAGRQEQSKAMRQADTAGLHVRDDGGLEVAAVGGRHVDSSGILLEGRADQTC